MSDPINPDHYRAGSIECIDAIEALGDGVPFCRASALSYLWRLGRKGDSADTLTDARKAAWYCDRLVGLLEKETTT